MSSWISFGRLNFLRISPFFPGCPFYWYIVACEVKLKWRVSHSVASNSLRPHGLQPTGLLSSVQLLSHVSLQPHGLQHARLPCPSPTPVACSNSCPLKQWCHSTISFSASTFSSYPQSFLESGSFPMSQLFTSGGQSIIASASASLLPMTIQSWFPLILTGLISLLSKRLSRVFSSTTVQKPQFFGAHPSSQSKSHFHT